jgi:hypothetical protein
VLALLSRLTGRAPPPLVCAQVFPCVKPLSFDKGEVVFVKGAPSMALYFVLEGEVPCSYAPCVVNVMWRPRGAPRVPTAHARADATALACMRALPGQCAE